LLWWWQQIEKISFINSGNGVFELSFVDITYLDQFRAQQSFNDYKKTLNLFWQTFPAANIIVLSSQEKIRSTVEVV